MYIGKLANAIIGEYYNQAAVSRNGGTTTGNCRIGVYNQSGAVPSALKADTGSYPVDAGYTYHSFTEFALDSIVNYHAFQIDNSSATYDRRDGGSAVNAYHLQSYGAFPDPSINDVTNYAFNIWGKIGHS